MSGEERGFVWAGLCVRASSERKSDVEVEKRNGSQN